MSALHQLYQDMIIDHGRKPRNFHVTENANHVLEGFNPLCGDRLTVYIIQKENLIQEISFQGSGCAISMASASLMTEAIKGKTVQEAKKIFEQFRGAVMGNNTGASPDSLGKLSVLLGVSEFPSRIKCAILAWHTLINALKNGANTVSTEDGK